MLSLIKIKNHYVKKIKDWLLPHACILCHARTTRCYGLCKECEEDLPRLENACPQCARPLPISMTCGNCLAHPPAFTRTWALYFYESPVTHLITHLKFGEQLTHARLLGQLLLNQIQDHWYQEQPLPTMIIPVPLHPKRLQERGFNQAVEIARPIAAGLRISLNTHQCQRIKYTEAQTTLSAAAREKNIKNAFSVEGQLPDHVAVVDDVMTTGHTLAEFCQTLKKAGVKTIDIWCCARAVF